MEKSIVDYTSPKLLVKHAYQATSDPSCFNDLQDPFRIFKLSNLWCNDFIYDFFDLVRIHFNDLSQISKQSKELHNLLMQFFLTRRCTFTTTSGFKLFNNIIKLYNFIKLFRVRWTTLYLTIDVSFQWGVTKFIFKRLVNGFGIVSVEFSISILFLDQPLHCC